MAFSKKDKQGFGLIAGALLIALTLVVAKFQSEKSLKPDASGCISPVTAGTVFVIDNTETVSQQTRDEIVARALAHVEHKVQANERVTVFSVTDVSRQNLVPVFSRCKPQREGNRLVESPRLLEKNFKAKFHEPLGKALSTISSDSKESPVAQAIIDISLTQYLRNKKNSLMVFSDMLEHVPGKFTMYPPQACRDQQSTVKAFRESRNGARERPTFVNTSVSLNIIPRTQVSRATLACRDQLWPWFFGDNQGPDVSFTPDFLPGY
ncbi:hypothetical protein [Caenimonas sp. SL110]|uniref:hypothetical protein n=1 Tax=Caenimonas sp. SL110 TaxID=1450524 RepID=UPI000652B87B|nr:hypothetical protein [Caenimonas sp. SL110]